MLYQDKNGVYWKEEDVASLTESEIAELELKETHFDFNDIL